MTLIATICDEQRVYAFGDLLVTKNHRYGGVVNEIPAAWRGNEQPPIHVSNLRRKIFMLRPDILFLWAGRLDIARAVLLELIRISSDPIVKKRDRFNAVLQAQRGQEFSGQIVFTPLGLPSTVLHVNCTELKIPALGKLVIAGEGRDEFLDVIGDADRARAISAANHPYHRAALIEGFLIWLTIYHAHEAVASKWGGGIETFIGMNRVFLPVEHVIHSFMEMRRDGANWDIWPHAYVLTKRYLNTGKLHGARSELVIGELDRIEGTADYHVIPSILASNDDRLPAPVANYAFASLDRHFLGIESSVTHDAICRTALLEAADLLYGVTFDARTPLLMHINTEGRQAIIERAKQLIFGPNAPEPDVAFRLRGQI